MTSKRCSPILVPLTRVHDTLQSVVKLDYLSTISAATSNSVRNKSLSRTRNHLTSLPNELLIEIGKNLDPTDLSKLLQVNHHTAYVLTQTLYDDIVRKPCGYKPHLEITYKMLAHSVRSGMLAPMVNLMVRGVALPTPIVKEAIRIGQMIVLRRMLFHNEPAVREAITEEYEPNCDDEYPLTTAVRTGGIGVIVFVLRFLDPGHPSILQAIQEATSRNKIAFVITLIPQLSDEQVSSAFHHACNANRPNIAHLLITKLPIAERRATATKGVSAAIRSGQPNVLRYLIALDADLHVSAGLDPHYGWNEYVEEMGNHLHWLATQGLLEWRNKPDQLLETYEVLLDSGLDVNETNSYNDTILMTIARNGPKSIGRNHRPPYRQMRKVHTLFRRLLRLVLSRPGVNVNVRDITGETAFGIAVRRGEYQMQNLLIQHGARTRLGLWKLLADSGQGSPAKVAIFRRSEFPNIAVGVINNGIGVERYLESKLELREIFMRFEVGVEQQFKTSLEAEVLGTRISLLRFIWCENAQLWFLSWVTSVS
ncbi:ankyrin repeat-containing domain protein [Morchella snyderi]|nr:ankyrin repeat-containing domain protein [Morchella snyderi]